MADLKSKLRSMVGGGPIKEQAPEPSQQAVSGPDWQEIGGELQSNDDGHYILRQKRFPLEFNHGIEIRTFLDLTPQHLVYLAKDARLAQASPESVLLLDTETTGLAGGTGTVPFMVGLAFFQDDHLHVEQYVLHEPGHERAMLRPIRERFESCSALVSFNGKTYDLPLLHNRLVLNRIEPVEINNHIDLLHTVRRFWRRRLDSCSLQSIEQHVLGLQRTGDVPGALIPSLYFQFLRDGNLQPLVPVFQHNSMDLVSLVSFMTVIAHFFDSPQSIHHNQADMMGILRTLDDLGLGDELEAFFQRLFELNITANEEMTILRAQNLKRLNRWQDAIHLYHDMIDNGRRLHFHAYIELAKIYEHRQRDFDKALDMVQRAQKRLELYKELQAIDEILHLEHELLHRFKRITAKRQRILS